MAKKKVDAAEELWDRMPGESIQSYTYFCAYRDMIYSPATNPDDIPKLDLIHGKRSIRKIAEKLGKSRQTIGNLSSRFNWVIRCDAYDLYMLRRQRDRKEAKILKMQENHAAIAEQMQKRAMRRLLSLTDDDIDVGDMIRMIDIGVKIERLSRGESTEKQEVSGKTTVTHSGSVQVMPDLSALSVEEMDAYERILDKLYPKPDD